MRRLLSRKLLVSTGLIGAVVAVSIWSVLRTTAVPEEVAVERNYLAFWHEYGVAFKNLNAEGLESVMAGEALSQAQETINKLGSTGVRLHMSVDHDYEQINVVNDQVATIFDQYFNRSYATGPVIARTDPINEMTPNSFQLEKQGGTWKVVQIGGAYMPAEFVIRQYGLQERALSRP